MSSLVKQQQQHMISSFTEGVVERWDSGGRGGRGLEGDD